MDQTRPLFQILEVIRKIETKALVVVAVVVV